MESTSQHIRWLFVAIIGFALSWTAYAVFYYTNVEEEQNKFQQHFNALEVKQQGFIKTLRDIVNENASEDIWKLDELQNSRFSVHLFQGDSLIYWNNNHIDFRLGLDDHLAHFVAKFPNGYYLVDKVEVHDVQIFVASKLKNEYYYQNSNLENTLADYFNLKNEIQIDLVPSEDSFEVTSVDGSSQLYITVLPDKTIGMYKQLLIYFLFVIGITCLLVFITHSLKPIAKRNAWLVFVYPIFLVSIRYYSIKHDWFSFFSDFEIYDPNLYAHSSVIPNLGSLIISLSTAFVIISWTLSFIRLIQAKKMLGSSVLLLLYLGLLAYSILINTLLESLVLNSSIYLEIDEVFSLDVYSLIALLIIASLFFSYYLLIRKLSIKIIQSRIKLTTLSLFWFFSGVGLFLLEILYYNSDPLYATWPILVNGLFFFVASKEIRLNTLKYHIATVIVFAFYGAVILINSNAYNEMQKREVYANQLISDKDLNMELEYIQTIDKLLNNPSFYEILDEVDYFSSPYFSIEIENCCFGSFWEQYELDFFFFYEDGSPILEYINERARSQENLDHIIKKHAEPSSIAKELYFITDYYDQLSYISHHQITKSNGEELAFYILFKSKKIPEKIGFPRLLMNEKSYVFQNLEGYSIARYSNHELVMRFGAYNFPLKLDVFYDKIDSKPTFRSSEGMSHLVYKEKEGQGVVISKPEKKFIEKLSIFSYLVVFFSVFALITPIFIGRVKLFPFKGLQLSLKIQTVLIGIVVGTFLIFVTFAIQNVRKQYNTNTLHSLKEKTESIDRILTQRLGDSDALINTMHGDYLNYILKRFSKVFGADINFYSVCGNMFATSQIKLFEKGISSKIINSEAFFNLHHQQKSEFYHYEEYGKLSFLSGYTPLVNHEGKILGYINLQHFSKQNTFEIQMNSFIVTVINVTVLLLVMSVLLAIIISGWITTPLRLIQQSFAKVEFGKENKPILYTSDDEIGALVKEYNNKLAELELKAIQLARSERETAWREMAKQVAHEIKNPLTPMKLRVQHFQRSYNPNDENAKKKMDNLFASLIEQIDALTKIANEFSNFAKMPKANEDNINLIPIIEKIIDLYSSPDIYIDFENYVGEDAHIYADKDLIVRVFNNLIKNAIQATKENEPTLIHIALKKEGNDYIISIRDQGVGISKAIEEKMFSPNFTTKSRGSGLGLAMTKQIINNHNGEIWFESKENEGATFYIKLPGVVNQENNP